MKCTRRGQVLWVSSGGFTLPGTVKNVQFDKVLFPGRHHVLTLYQATYLKKLVSGATFTDLSGESVNLVQNSPVVFALTSATHERTRRNPIPAARREAAIERFAVLEDIEAIVAPVPDVPPREDFASITLKHVAHTTRLECTPQNTLVACSTPELIEAYHALGFHVVGVEMDQDPIPKRPGEILAMLAHNDQGWRQLTHKATLDVFDRYMLDTLVIEVSSDPVVGDDGRLTDADRDWSTYQEAFAKSAKRKWDQVKDMVKPGRIVDVGCAAGAVLELASKDPRLLESDLFGVEVARPLYAEALHASAQGRFSNPNVFFLHHNMLQGPAFPKNSVDTTLTLAVCHEIYSFGGNDSASKLAALRTLAHNIYDHTAPGGVWVNLDVCGPDHPDTTVVLQLRSDNGLARAALIDTTRNPHDTKLLLENLSTAARLDQYVHDARQLGLEFDLTEQDESSTHRSFELSLRLAMEFLARYEYLDNWRAEANETFCHFSFAEWEALLIETGFVLDPVSGSFTNPWLVENRFAPNASLLDQNMNKLAFPETHVRFAARKVSL